MFITTLGCDKVYGDCHIDTDEGIFGVLDEKFIRVKTGTIIPAKENTSCKCRRTPRCNINCSHAVHAVVVGTVFSPRAVGKRM